MTKTCSKCKEEMVKGQLMIPGGIEGVRWMELPKKKKIFVRLNNLPKYIVYKCKSCGFCENYIELKQ